MATIVAQGATAGIDGDWFACDSGVWWKANVLQCRLCCTVFMANGPCVAGEQAHTKRHSGATALQAKAVARHGHQSQSWNVSSRSLLICTAVAVMRSKKMQRCCSDVICSSAAAEVGCYC